MSCTPSCTVANCQSDHGPRCPHGTMCQNRASCKLYHPPRVRGANLNSSAPEFTPPANTKPAAVVAPKTISPTPTPTTTTTAAPGITPIVALNPSATPFKPLPPPTKIQQQTTQQTPYNTNTNNNQQQHQQQQQQQYYPEDYYETDDYEYYDEDEDDYYDDSEAEEEEFRQLVEEASSKPENKNATEQEIEAIANELFYAKRFAAAQSSTPPQQSSSSSSSRPEPQQQQRQHQSSSPVSQQPTFTSQPQTQIAVTSNTKPVCRCCGGTPVLCEGSTVCISREICVCVDDEVDQAKLATWVVASRLCTCCAGFIYKCKKQQPGCKRGECDCKAVKAAA